MCKWWNSFGNTWWAERMGQRPNKGDHLLDIPCVGDTGASRPVWLSVGAGRECRVSLRSSIWSWSLDILWLYFVVSQLLTKTNLVWQCKASMLGIPWYTTFKIAFKFKSSLGRFILLVGVFWGQVDGREVPVWTPRRRTGWQFRLVNVQHAPFVRPWKNLYISYRQLDPRRQVGEHDEIRGRTCEGLRSINSDSDAEKTGRSNSQPHSLRSSWLVYGRDWMVFNEKQLFSTSEDRQAQGPQGVRWKVERKSAHVTWRLRREDAQSEIHPPKRWVTGHSAPKKSISRESW